MKPPLSDASRRLLCRLAFLLCCGLPTLMVFYHAFHRPTPADWSQRLQAYLGVNVAVDRVETPLPYTVVLRGVTLRDASQSVIVALGAVRVETGTTQRIIVDEPVNISADGLAKIIQRVTDCSLRSGTSQGVWRIALRQLTIDHGPPEAVLDHRTLSPVELQLQCAPQQSFVLLRSKLLGQAPQTEPIEVQFNRQRDGQGWIESAVVSTGRQRLPTWIVGSLIESATTLGPQCHFQGQLQLNRAARGWDGELKGEFSQIDLEHVSQAAALMLGGSGRAVIHRCVIQANQLVQFEASFDSQFGWFDQTQWRGVARLFSLPNLNVTDRVTYSSLAMNLRYLGGWIELSQFEVRDRQGHLLTGAQPGFCQIGLEQFAKQLWPHEKQHDVITDASVEFLHRFQLPPTQMAREPEENSTFR